MNGGINQLVDTYKGNPQPLANQVRKAQQGQPPGEIPADLEEALALQEIAKLRQGAQNQQAMQAGGAQPSVVEKLRQMLGGMQQQAQMAPPAQGAPAPQGQPVMAARGGSIDQLMSNLGRHYAGGGIIAFDGTNGSKVPTEEELEAQRKADREKIDALAKALGQTGGEYAGKSMAALADIAALVPRGLAGAADTALIRPLRALGAKVDYLSPALTPGNQSSDTMTPFYDRYIRAKEGAAPSEVKPTPVPGAPLDPEVEKLKRLAAARAQTGINTNPALKPKPPVEASPDDAKPRPSAGGAGAGTGGSGAATQGVDPESLDAITRKYLKGEFAINPETERDKAVNWARQTMGLDALLGEKERRAFAREEAIRNIEAKRTPAWVEGLAGARKSVRGGLGSLIGQMGDTADTVRQGYEMQSLVFQKELDQLRDVITDAKISGNKELVKEGMAAYKEVDARRRAAAQSAASLLNTDATNATRLQTARDAAAGRNQFAAAQLEEKKLRRLQEQKNFLAQEERKWQDTLSRNPEYKKLIDQRSMQERLLYMPNIDPKTQEKAQATVDAINERIAKMLPTAGGGTVNIPPPPPGAVRETVKKS